ncbi:hypothetical protein HK102_004780 [Quaeritorhiza haematococci]|nr:hypothetical protein HK102_004780 [Quaeritorhiza haematococci]
MDLKTRWLAALPPCETTKQKILDDRLFQALAVHRRSELTLEKLSRDARRWVKNRLAHLNFKCRIDLVVTKPSGWDLTKQLSQVAVPGVAYFKCHLCSRKLLSNEALWHCGGMGPLCQECVINDKELFQLKWEILTDDDDESDQFQMDLYQRWKRWFRKASDHRDDGRLVRKLFEDLLSGLDIIILQDSDGWVGPILKKLNINTRFNLVIIEEPTDTDTALERTTCTTPATELTETTVPNEQTLLTWEIWCKTDRRRGCRKTKEKLDYRLFQLLSEDNRDKTMLQGLSATEILWVRRRLERLGFESEVKLMITKPADWDLAQQLTRNLTDWDCHDCSRKLSNKEAYFHEGGTGPLCEDCVHVDEREFWHPHVHELQIEEMTLHQKWKTWLEICQYKQSRLIELLFQNLPTDSTVVVLDDNDRRWCNNLSWIQPFLLKLGINVVHTAVVVVDPDSSRFKQKISEMMG